MEDLKVNYDEHPEDVMEKVNDALKKYGLCFRELSDYEDSSTRYKLIQLEEKT